ncbi:MAG: hypothetical protein ACI38Q_05370 [Candidatus Bruticola sp.]
MLCIKCGFDNEQDARICKKCGAALPRYVAEAEVEEVKVESPVINERLQIFEQAVDRVGSGEWSTEEFAHFLEETAAVLADKEQGIRSIDIPEEAAEDFKEELEVGFEGIKLYNQGMQVFFAYVESEDPALLEEGLELVRRGNERINEAMRINRENRSKLEESIGGPFL